MNSLSMSVLVALKSLSRSKCDAFGAHGGQRLAARSGSVKGPSKHVHIFSAAHGMGSRVSSLHTVPPTMAVWLHDAISILSREVDPILAETPVLTVRCLSFIS